MEEVFENPVQLAKGINVKDLMTSHAEFTLDMDFNRTKDGIDLAEYGDIIADIDDEEDSDEEDVFKNVEKRTEEMMLSSPEYHSFDELAGKMMDIPCSPSGAVKITILEEGEGPLVPADAEVSIHYAAYWEKAKVPFDSSLTTNGGNPMYIRLGGGRFLPGLEAALVNVRGPTARLLALLQPAAAWGAGGAPPRIRAEPALFVIALAGVGGASLLARTFDSLPMEEQTKYACTVRTVTSLRSEAKDLFNRKRYRRAIETYQRAMHVLSLSRPETEREERDLKNMRIKQLVNLAVCYHKLNKPNRVIDTCENIDKIIDIDTHCKALFYYGKAYETLGKLESALKCYKKALKLEPNNKEIGSLLADIDGKIKKSAEDEVRMWRKAFKSEAEATVAYKVDEDFENGVREMCQELESREEFTRLDLPALSAGELACLRALAARFDSLTVQVDGEGAKTRVAVLKNC